jgi:phage-related protein
MFDWRCAPNEEISFVSSLLRVQKKDGYARRDADGFAP